jgi:capsid protein
VQLAGEQQPHQVLGVAAVGLDALARRARDLAGRRDHALHAAALELAREAVTGRSGLIGRPHRPR